MADQLEEALAARLGPGCSAAPALSWDGAQYDTRAIAVEVPAAVADRLVDDLRTAHAAERLGEALYAGDRPGDRPMHLARALGALLESVRGRLGRLQAGRALDAALSARRANGRRPRKTEG